MYTNNRSFEANYKKLGLYHFDGSDIEGANNARFQSYIKVLFVPKGYELTVDFKEYKTRHPSLFFINSNQYLDIQKAGSGPAVLLYYNRDFYCVQIHDREVACDGLLFNNIFAIPSVELGKDEYVQAQVLFDNIQEEIAQQDSSAEEMIRTYLKQLIILSTRHWKKQNLNSEIQHAQALDQEVFRDFSRLVEIHYRDKHNVADYAALLSLAPKTLTHKFSRLGLEGPNSFIINRILLEAKRLLIYTEKTVKEIAYDLGYEDPAYFNRLFTQKIGSTPANFKKNYL